MNVVLQDLALDYLYVISPGSMQFSFIAMITACGIDGLPQIMVPDALQ